MFSKMSDVKFLDTLPFLATLCKSKDWMLEFY